MKELDDIYIPGEYFLVSPIDVPQRESNIILPPGTKTTVANMADMFDEHPWQGKIVKTGGNNPPEVKVGLIVFMKGERGFPILLNKKQYNLCHINDVALILKK